MMHDFRVEMSGMALNASCPHSFVLLSKNLKHAECQHMEKPFFADKKDTQLQWVKPVCETGNLYVTQLECYQLVSY